MRWAPHPHGGRDEARDRPHSQACGGTDGMGGPTGFQTAVTLRPPQGPPNNNPLIKTGSLKIAGRWTFVFLLFLEYGTLQCR